MKEIILTLPLPDFCAVTKIAENKKISIEDAIVFLILRVIPPSNTSPLFISSKGDTTQNKKGAQA